jgi:hypothetical protein
MQQDVNLEDNRAGRLSDAQVKQFEDEIRENIVRVIGQFVLTAVPCVVVLIALYSMWIREAIKDGGTTLGSVIFVLFLTALYIRFLVWHRLITLLHFLGMRRDRIERKVFTREGLVRFKRKKGSLKRTRMSVDGRRLTWLMYSAVESRIPSEGRYRLYLAQYSRLLVNGEPLP